MEDGVEGENRRTFSEIFVFDIDETRQTSLIFHRLRMFTKIPCAGQLNRLTPHLQMLFV